MKAKAITFIKAFIIEDSRALMFVFNENLAVIFMSPTTK